MQPDDGPSRHSLRPSEQALRQEHEHQHHRQEQHEVSEVGHQRDAEVIEKPTMKLPTKAPSRLPAPPRITTTSASGSMSASRPG